MLAGRPGHRLGLALLGGGALGVAVDAGDGDASTPPTPRGRSASGPRGSTTGPSSGLLVLVTWPLLLFPDGRLPSRRWRPVAWLLGAGARGDRAARHARPGRRSTTSTADVPNPLGIPASWDVGRRARRLRLRHPARRGRRDGRRAGPRAPALAIAAMRAALWASRGLAANFVLCLALTDDRLADGAFYAATLTTSVGAFAATAAVVILRDRAVEVDLLLRRAFIVAGVAVGSLLAVPRRLRGRRRRSPARRRARSPAASAPRCSRSRCGSACATASTARCTATATRRPPCGGSASSSSSPTSPPTRCRAWRPRCARRSARRRVRIEPDPALGLPRAHAGGGAARAADRARRQPPRARARAADRRRAGARRARTAPADLALAEVLVRPARARARRAADGRRGPALARGDRHRARGGATAAAPRAARRPGLGAGRDRADAAGRAERGRTRAATGSCDGRARADRGGGRRRAADRPRPASAGARGPRAGRRAACPRRPARAARGRDRRSPPVPLPAAVELALYRIATEALTNAVRHAARAALPGRAARRRRRGRARGRRRRARAGAGATAGVGLRSMRERAAELGGRVEFASAVAAGSRSVSVLPLAAARPA